MSSVIGGSSPQWILCECTEPVNAGSRQLWTSTLVVSAVWRRASSERSSVQTFQGVRHGELVPGTIWSWGSFGFPPTVVEPMANAVGCSKSLHWGHGERLKRIQRETPSALRLGKSHENGSRARRRSLREMPEPEVLFIFVSRCEFMTSFTLPVARQKCRCYLTPNIHPSYFAASVGPAHVDSFFANQPIPAAEITASRSSSVETALAPFKVAP